MAFVNSSCSYRVSGFSSCAICSTSFTQTTASTLSFNRARSAKFALTKWEKEKETYCQIVMRQTLPPVTIHPGDSIQETVAKLLPLYTNDPERFERIVANIQVLGRSSRPRFPEVQVSSIGQIPDEDREEFLQFHIDNSYIHWRDPEAQERVKITRELQYARWNWACENIDQYINTLRLSGFSDQRIQNMLDGTPLCFKTPEVYRQLRSALKDLAPAIEEELGWSGVGFVITGSSVPGFSQNPCKGVADRPTRITSESSSDVDICIVADGVNNFMLARVDKGEKEPCGIFPTTSSPTSSATRFGVRDFSAISKVIDQFQKEWSDKIEGGLQLTFAEDDAPTPPWEARINISVV